MEKYRQFADGGTGVNPFVPVWSHHKSSLPVRALKLLLGPPLALVRLALLGLSLLWLALAEALCAIVVVGALRWPLYRLLTSIGARLALVALGVLPLSDSLADHRRLRIAPPKTSRATVFDAGHGALVFANQQGVTDVLFLCLRMSPTFVFVAVDGAPSKFGVIGAIRRALAGVEPAAGAGAAKPQPLAEIAEAAKSGWGGPVVVFAEGANTTGGCVLSWKAKTFEGSASLEKPVGPALVAIEYSKGGAYTPHHTAGSASRHLFWQCIQPWHTVRAQWLPTIEASATIKGKPLDEQWAMLRTVLVRMLPGAVEVEVGAEKFVEFKAYWDAAQKKGYTKQQPQANKKKA